MTTKKKKGEKKTQPESKGQVSAPKPEERLGANQAVVAVEPLDLNLDEEYSEPIRC